MVRHERCGIFEANCGSAQGHNRQSQDHVGDLSQSRGGLETSCGLPIVQDIRERLASVSGARSTRRRDHDVNRCIEKR
ncbi:hypothetical protein VTN02DRAFT_1309 [Thermoascus thermophilus]